MLRKSVTLLDQDKAFCETLSTTLQDTGEFSVDAVYHDMERALYNLGHDNPDVIIVDIQFSGKADIQFISAVRERNPKTIVLVYTYADDEQIIFQALGQGACGYLLKQNGLDELLPSLQVLNEGGSPLSPQVARSIVRSIQINELSPLSPRESTVLKLLSQGKTYSSIALALDLSNETVKTHLKNIYKKLNVNSKAQAIQKAMEEQLVMGVY